ncbi:hypothetical protein ACF0H5_003550 [Mactra antiquata]
MPQVTKQSQRQVATPSPTPGDVLNTLLVVKDAVNTALLNEHTRFADLSNILSEVESQVREAFETTIKTLKTEIEKRKRKVVPGIKKLQELLKSLSKSETKCKASEKGYKNAVAKKAKRRIRDTQKYLKEYVTLDSDLNLSSFVMDQITNLCHRLMNVPASAASFKRQMEVCETPLVDNSESDSESSKSGSRNATPIDHIYNEIDNLQANKSHGTLKYPKPEHKIFEVFSDNREARKTRKCKHDQHDGRTNHRLNSVMLFSSDSDSDERGRRPQRPTLSTDSGHPSSRDRDYEQLLPQDPEQVFKNYKSDSNVINNQQKSALSMANVTDYEIPIPAKHDTLFAPIATHPEHRSQSSSSQSKTNTLLLSATAKRLLPATPKTRSVPDGGTIPSRKNSTQSIAKPPEEALDMTDSACDAGSDNNYLATNTVELLAAAETLLNDIQASNDKQDADSNSNIKPERETPTVSTLPQDKVEHTALIEPDYVDIEEIKFRESVRTARREILDRLKNRCPHHEKHSLINEKSTTEPIFSSSNANKYDNQAPLNTHQGIESRQKTDDIKQSTTLPKFGSDVNYSRDAGSFPSRQDLEYEGHSCGDGKQYGGAQGVYKSRLIHTYQSKSPVPSIDKAMGGKPSDNDLNNSLVSTAIQKFENVVNTQETRRTTNRKPKPVTKYALTPKYRSTSEPRTSSRVQPSSSSSGMTSTNRHMSRQSYQNNALLPRLRTNSFDADNNGFEDTPRSLSKSSTESDLLKLLENESPSFIRKQWSRRRSTSMTPKIPAPEVKPSTRGPLYEKYTTFTVPNHSTRCHISSIVVLQNDNLILLDETHGYLHLYDQHLKHKDSYRLLDTPKGCVRINECTVAVSFPYKKSICTYSVTMGAILSDREISVPCSAWIVDIAYSRKILYVLCKEGDVHLLSNDGSESSKICLGMSGKLFVPNNGNRLYIMGENKINKFDSEGVLLSSKSEVDTRSMLAIDNTIYVADRRNHKIAPLTNTGDVSRLTSDKLVYPLAMCNSINGKYLYVSQFEESMDIVLTRTIQIFKLKST